MSGQPAPQDLFPQDLPGAHMYAVYCTAVISREVLMDFLWRSRDVGYPVIVTSERMLLSNDTRGPSLLTEKLEFPFLDWDIHAIAKTYRQQIHGPNLGPFSIGSFIILDERTESDRTCLVVSDSSDGLQTLRSDFEMALDCFTPGEIMGWRFDEFQLQPFYHGKITVTRAKYELAYGGERGSCSVAEVIRRNKHLFT